MEYRQLGTTGLRVSLFGFGTWTTTGALDAWGLEEEEAALDQALFEKVRTAFDAGINFFDTAEVYDMGLAESMLGRVLDKAINQTQIFTRSDIVVATKFIKRGSGPNDVGLSRKHLFESARSSLERLGLDYVDLAFAHRPDPHTPMEEVVRGFAALIAEGKCLYWGTSEWPAVLIERAKHVAARLGLPGPVAEQSKYNMLHRARVERDLAPLHDGYWDREGGLGLTTFSPLAYGLLSGKYNKGVPEDSRFAGENFSDSKANLDTDEGKANLEKVRKVAEVAERVGCSTAQLALRWLTLNPRVSCVLLGASKPEQIRENVECLKFTLSDEVQAELEEILQNKAEPERVAKWALYSQPNA